MSVVFEDLDPAPGRGPGRPRRRRSWWVASAAVAVVLVAGGVWRGGDASRPDVRPSSSAPSPTVVVSDVQVVELDSYALPGVMTVAGAAGWGLDPAGTTADQRRYTAVDLATGTLHPTVTFGVADRSPLPTVTAEVDRLRLSGQLGADPAVVSTVLVAHADTMAADVTYVDGPIHAVQRVWSHDGVALFVRVADRNQAAVAAVFDEAVLHGAVTP